MSLIAGQRLGPYEILSLLGAGGMGEVYRARDTKLNRDVAIKVLLPAVANDPDRLARFSREAQVLASLNHPNIAQIHGLEESNGVTALVMELVEGEDLSQRIARGPIPIDEALPIARQIAEALEAAHDHGIIHRDLKPANIKVRPDGTVKVLDFGLAKAVDPTAGSSATAMNSPTLSLHATEAGIILGTAAYMSPEQARGKSVDRRTDIWAFGCVLYEMLAGRPAFDTGETVSDAIASILKADVDWSVLPADVPDQVRLLVRRCLEKDRAVRIGDIGTARFLLTETLVPIPVAGAAVAPEPPSRARSALAVSAGAIAGAALAAGIVWWLMQSTPVTPQAMRFAIVPPASAPLLGSDDRQMVISPDGAHVVYVAAVGSVASREVGDGGQLMVRAIDQVEAVAIRGVTNARAPFISPDGKWIGYFDSLAELKKVSMSGGPTISLCRCIGAPPRGGSWGPDDTIVFATVERTTGLLSVSAGGGEPMVLTTPDMSTGESDHVFPSHLPGGRAVLFTIARQSVSVDNSLIAVLDLATGRSKTLIRGGAQAQYVEPSAGSGEPGLLIYAVAGSLRAVRFDPIALEVLSDPVPVQDQVTTFVSGAAEYTVSRTGALVYAPGGAMGVNRYAPTTLAWVDRRGNESAVAAPPRGYVSLRLSPDGSTIALDARDQDRDIWTFHLARQTMTRLTMDPAIDGFPLWTPDGRSILFESNRAGVFDIYSQAADGTGAAEALTKGKNPMWPFAISPDGTRLVVNESDPTTGADLMVLTLDGKSGPQPLVRTRFYESHGEISPDGRWLAYQSDESGETQVHVRPFPDANAGHWQVSAAGGAKPVWSPDGKELFYLAGRAMMSVSIQTAPVFSAGNPTKLFEGRYRPGMSARAYDVSRDGQRFLMIKEVQDTAEATRPPMSMVVVLNWFEELKRMVPSK